MKIALKYGLLITAGVAVWIIVAHTLVPNPQSAVHKIPAAVFFNLLQITGTYLGLREARALNGGVLTFKQGVNQGFSISFVYGLSASILFTLALLVVGRERMMGANVRAMEQPTLMVIEAFLGLFLSAIVLGMIYSTLISFVFVKQVRPRPDTAQ